jgi:hypothetical protein
MSTGWRDHELTVNRFKGRYDPGYEWPATDGHRVPQHVSTPVFAFGECFASIWRLSLDRRCVVSYNTLRWRLNAGWEPEAAATTPTKQTGPIELTAFGVRFASIRELVDDERCVVSYRTLKWRIQQGWEAEKAATTPPKRRKK